MTLNFKILLYGLLFCNVSSWAAPINGTVIYYPMSCADLDEDQHTKVIIQIQVDVNKEPFYVKCNHEVKGGGWTVILNRYDGSRDFNCKWNDCKNGFGNINREFFIGLEKLHEITSSTLHELLFIMEDFENQTKTARFDVFAISGESNSYMINVLGNYTGDAGDSFTYHSGYKFLTIDRDVTDRCAKERKGPGWFNFCTNSNIFGEYVDKGNYKNDGNLKGWGMYWATFRGSEYALKKLAMMIRPL